MFYQFVIILFLPTMYAIILKFFSCGQYNFYTSKFSATTSNI